MSTQGNGQSGDSAQNEVRRPAEKPDPAENAGKRIMGDLNSRDHEGLVERIKDDRDPEKRLSKRTAGRSELGECAIADIKMCGKNKDVVVQLRNGLPEKFETGSQSWERDERNSQLWHIKQGGDKFDLKADVRLQADEITARVKYASGREVTYTNGEPTQIKEANGEKRNPDGLKVNVKDGEIKGPPLPKPNPPEAHKVETPIPPAPGWIKDAASPHPEPQALQPQTMQERTSRAQAEANKLLERISAHSLPLPPHREAADSRHLNDLPVPKPAILSRPQETPMPPAPHVESMLQQPLPSAMSPLEPKLAQEAPQPVAPRAERYAPASLSPVSVEPQQSTPEIVPVPMSQLKNSHAEAPAPVRAANTAPRYVDVVPSVSKPEEVQVAKPQPHKDQAANEAGGSKGGFLRYQPGRYLDGSVEQRERQAQPGPEKSYPAPTMFGVAADGHMYPISGTAQQNEQLLKSGAETQAKRGPSHVESAEGYFTGSGYFDAHNRFEIPPNVLKRNAHQVQIDIYNYDTGIKKLTGQAFGHLDAANSLLIIDAPPQWARRQFRLTYHDK